MRRVLILSGLLAVLATDASAGPALVRAKRDTMAACGPRSGLALVFVRGGRGGSGPLPDFLIGKYEVTQADWAEVLGQRPSHFGGCAECPVERVSWHDVQRFLRAINARTGRAYRLPSEDEWEYAARGGVAGTTAAYAGSARADDVAWYAGNAAGRPHRVGTLQPNALGLYDMSGNVDEWCAPVADVSAGHGVLRGGAWMDAGDGVGVRGRNVCAADRRLHTIGFRLAQSIEPPRANERLRIAPARGDAAVVHDPGGAVPGVRRE